MKVFLNDVEGFGEDSLLWFTKLLVEVWTILKHYTFRKQHSKCPTCQVLKSRGLITEVVHYKWWIKTNYKHVVEVGTIVKCNKEYMHVLEDYLKVCDSLVVMLYERWQKLDNCFQLALCNLFFVEWQNLQHLKSCENALEGFTVTREWTHQFMKQYIK
jgi:hypothetical protein